MTAREDDHRVRGMLAARGHQDVGATSCWFRGHTGGKRVLVERSTR